MATTCKDPITELFSQTTKYKSLGLDLLDNTSSMGETGIEFIDYYSEAMKNLDEFFMNNFHLSDQKPTFDTLAQKYISQSSNINPLTKPDEMRPSLKRTKMSQMEYIEKLLHNFGQNNPDLSTLEITNRSSLPLCHEKIVIDLKKNTVSVHPNSSTKIEEENFRIKIEEDIVEPPLEQRIKIEEAESPVQEPVRVSLSSRKLSEQRPPLAEMTFMKKDAFTEPEDHEDKENSQVLANQSQNIPSKSNSLGSAIPENKMSLANRDSLRKSLLDKFQQSEVQNSKLELANLPSDDKAFTRDLEELIMGIENYHSSQQNQPKPQPNGSVVDTSFKSLHKDSTEYYTANNSTLLSNKINQLLYSKTLNEDEIDVLDEQRDPFRTFEETYSDDPFDEYEDDEQYNVSDYSNEAEETLYYKFHEQYEDGHAQGPKMFQLFNSVQFNVNATSSYNSNPYATQTFGQSNANQGSYFNPPMSYIPSENSLGFGNSINQNTMFHDYMYYLKEQQNIEGVSAEEQAKLKKINQLNASPFKSAEKMKRLYCNNKRIPLWATNLQEVEKISKDQKKLFNPNQIFGHFNVENLDLVDVFQIKNKRLLKIRGSSANWRNEQDTPSNQKSKSKRDLDFYDDNISLVKKVIEFKN